jgi:hypothetical protein
MRAPLQSLHALLAASLLVLAGCSSPEESAATPVTGPDLEPGLWNMVEPPGTVCGNGSQFRFFVNPSATSSKNLLVMFEPGGACWDYDSCSGKSGLGASNTDGVDENHMALWGLAFPFLRRTDPENPVGDWNMIYVPYCTGDVHIGNKVATYPDPEGKAPDLVFHHNGYENTRAVTEWAKETFQHVGRLMVSGCSAGGVGAISSYAVVRETIAPEHSYLLDDSGPIFPGSVRSKPLYDQIRASWGLDPVFEKLPFPVDVNDLGGMSLRMADALPNDRLAVTYFQRDHVFSAYSYERFYPELSDEQRLGYWKDDTDLLVAAYAKHENMAYYLPWWRARADSHCATALDYVGAEIQEDGVDMNDFIGILMDDSKPLQSFRESPQPGEDMP